MNEGYGDFVVIGTGPTDRHLAFQRVDYWVAPAVAGSTPSQQRHLDIRVDNIDDTEQTVMTHGAGRVPALRGERGFRMFLDPAGHPFCLVFGQGSG